MGIAHVTELCGGNQRSWSSHSWPVVYNGDGQAISPRRRGDLVRVLTRHYKERQTMGNAFVHVELSTTDVSKAKDFYGELFRRDLEDVPIDGGTYTAIKVGKETGGGMMTSCAATSRRPDRSPPRRPPSGR
jgi:hypothetical protein